jgi:hypothetical protein
MTERPMSSLLSPSERAMLDTRGESLSEYLSAGNAIREPLGMTFESSMLRPGIRYGADSPEKWVAARTKVYVPPPLSVHHWLMEWRTDRSGCGKGWPKLGFESFRMAVHSGHKICQTCFLLWKREHLNRMEEEKVR